MKKRICAVVAIGVVTLTLLGGVGYTLSQPIQLLPIEKLDFESHRALDEGLRVQEMEEDLKALEEVLYEVHPKVVEQDHTWLDEAFDEAYSKVKEPLLLRDFHYMISELLAKFQDAHTSTFAKDLGESYMQANLKWVDEGLYVINSRFLKPKDRIVAINDMPIEEIYERAHKIISAENEYARRSRFITRIKTLSFIETCTGDRRVERITVERDGKLVNQPIIYGMTPYTNRQIQEEERKNWVRYEIDPNTQTSIFTLKTCEFNEAYCTVVRNMFEEMKQKQIKHLIIDVRGNGGGNSKVIDEIIHYLPVDRYVYYGVNARYSEAARLQRGYVRTNGTVSYSPGKKTNKKVEELLFDGDIYVLVDDHTFSSANWMGVIFQDSKLGTVVGEPTSNNPNSYGDVLQFQLPNSQIRYQVSMKRWVRPDQTKNDEDTLMPDVLVEPTLEEWVSGRDIILERTMALIKEKEMQ